VSSGPISASKSSESLEEPTSPTQSISHRQRGWIGPVQGLRDEVGRLQCKAVTTGRTATTGPIKSWSQARTRELQSASASMGRCEQSRYLESGTVRSSTFRATAAAAVGVKAARTELACFNLREEGYAFIVGVRWTVRRMEWPLHLRSI
jgi:hypothetical protein